MTSESVRVLNRYPFDSREVRVFSNSYISPLHAMTTFPSRLSIGCAPVAKSITANRV